MPSPSVLLKNLSLFASATAATSAHADPPDCALAPGLTGLVGPNGSGKSTLLNVISGRFAPVSGSVQVTGRLRWLDQTPAPETTLAELFGMANTCAAMARAEAGQATAEDLAAIDWTAAARMAAALDAAGLADRPATTPIGALSGGEARRASLAACLADPPDILLMDEPTNDLDARAREALIAQLKAFRGIAIVASHDRALLEHADCILSLYPPEGRLFGGNWSAYVADRTALRERAAGRLDRARREHGLTLKRAEQAAMRKAATDRQGKRLRASGSHGKMLMDAARNRSENSGSSAAKLAERQQADAANAVREAESAVARIVPVALSLPACHLPTTRQVARIEGVSLTRGTRQILEGVDLTLTGPERIALIGPNGAGKSTLLNILTGTLKPDAGQACINVPYAMLDQRVGLLGTHGTLIDAYARVHPDAERGEGQAALARLGLRADMGARPVTSLSGGECLRAGLAIACGGPQPPQLLILDEPTNHLDIAAREALESGLNTYDGALIVTSHDLHFLNALSLDRRVEIAP